MFWETYLTFPDLGKTMTITWETTGHLFWGATGQLFWETHLTFPAWEAT
jgi:hypothetical protein